MQNFEQPLTNSKEDRLKPLIEDMVGKLVILSEIRDSDEDAHIQRMKRKTGE